MNKWNLWIIVLLLTTGCATLGGYDDMVSSWVGGTADELIMAWGPPVREAKLSNGGRVLEYYDTQSTTYSGNAQAAYGQSPVPETIQYTCRTTFTVSPSGRISTYSWYGNNCYH